MSTFMKQDKTFLTRYPSKESYIIVLTTLCSTQNNGLTTMNVMMI